MNTQKRLALIAGFTSCGALLLALTGCATQRGGYSSPPPSSEIYVGVTIGSADDFYGPLSPYGRWEVVGSYGRCWIPSRVGSDWRPYSSGYWVRTDAGWYWQSDEPWGWATYHYGRWDFGAQLGWYWVPQTVWAPAWVAWNSGGGYIGWAPLPPSAQMSRGGVLEVNVRVIPTRAYVFVEERKFLTPIRPQMVITDNTTILSQTTHITNIKVVNNTVINEGPRAAAVERATGQKIKPVPVRELRRKQEAEVMTRQQMAAPADQKKVQPPPGRTEAEPREQKASPAPEPRPPRPLDREQPAPAPRERPAPAPKKHSEEVRPDRPVTPAPEARPDHASPQGKPDAKPEKQPPGKKKDKDAQDEEEGPGKKKKDR